MPRSTSSPRRMPDSPLIVAYGLGVDRTAMLIEFARRSIRPDLILFADTGGEKPETYAYLPIM
jgi:3'-phosphoadenosine 5'-phosphosulfate sulfotransferase (PAPS reductase)/FAD synthetase